MKTLNQEQVQSVNGGIIPLLIIAGKGFAAGFGLGVAAFSLVK